MSNAQATPTITAESVPLFFSIGRLCELLAAGPDDVRFAIEAANVAPVMQIDTIPYWNKVGFSLIQHQHEQRLIKRATAARGALPR